MGSGCISSSPVWDSMVTTWYSKGIDCGAGFFAFVIWLRVYCIHLCLFAFCSMGMIYDCDTFWTSPFIFCSSNVKYGKQKELSVMKRCID